MSAFTGGNSGAQKPLGPELVRAAEAGDLSTLTNLLQNGALCHFQEEETGRSVLMAAASSGNIEVVRQLLEYGAPWNAVDRSGLCAGDYALRAGHQSVVDEVVSAGVRAELLFAALADKASTESQLPSPPTGYLRRDVRYTEAGDALLDDDDRGVMMKWEKPLMQAHAQIICEGGGKDVLNVGFGLGLIDTAIQAQRPPVRSHTIIEAHPQVYAKMLADGWDKKPGVRILFGRWQDKISECSAGFDAVFFDTFDDMREFHQHLPDLVRPGGIYSFFNGLCPDNLIFQGVACEVIRIELDDMGFDCEFLQCEVDCGDAETWKETKFRYYVRSDYHLPVARRRCKELVVGEALASQS